VCFIQSECCTLNVLHYHLSRCYSGCNIAGGTAGVHFCYGDDGRLNGDAFAELVSEDDMTSALGKNKKHIGRRYIDGIFACFFSQV
jgi:hypothetical protein